MKVSKKITRAVYGRGVTRRLLQEWHALPGRKLFRKIGFLPHKSWSEAEEDLCLLKVAEHLDMLGDGFYVDVGANLPTRRSNTYALYRAGMRGLCLEPNIELAALFEKVREEDDLVCAAVGEAFAVEELRRFNYHVFSTCSQTVADDLLSGENRLQASLLRSSFVAMLPLRELLQRYHSQQKRGPFFLLKTDTEGFDLEALKSNDWDLYQPSCILTESTGQGEEIASYLQAQGYLLARQFPVNQLFMRKEDFEICQKANLFSSQDNGENI